MKNLFLTIAMFAATTASAQLEVNTVKDSIVYERTGMAALSHLSVVYYEEFDNYTFFFKDNSYTHITVIKHGDIGTKENLIQALELCIKSCETKEPFETSLYYISRYSKKVARMYFGEAVFYISTKECEEILNILK